MEKTINNAYCMSSFLTFRYAAEPNLVFGNSVRGGICHTEYIPIPEENKIACSSSEDIGKVIEAQLSHIELSKAAILLSGGIDSGILAAYMPEGTRAYTANAPTKSADIEIERAARVCEKYKLEHVIVDVTWDDYENCIDALMRHDGCPVFANEPQVYILADKIKRDGAEVIIFGDNADMAFGGYDRLLSRDWTYDEWVERFTFLKPGKILVETADVNGIFEKYREEGNGIDYLKFMNDVFAASSSGAYVNAFDCVGIGYLDPYAYMKMKEPLDLGRVRSGESKYLLRELYKSKFPEFEVPEKIAMARAVDYWLKDWKGPKRREFKRGCIEGLTGEQKFLVYSLERFLNIMEL